MIIKNIKTHFKRLKNFLRGGIIYKFYTRLRHAKNRFLGYRIKEQDYKSLEYDNLINLGNYNANWKIIDLPDEDDGIILSLGLGEEMSFDLDLVRKYNREIYIFDPTPRAINHYQNVMKMIDNDVIYDEKYNYNLKNLSSKNFNLIKKAAWNKTGKVKFYSPKNIEHVSHSIVNFQNNYSNDTDFIEVDTVDFRELLQLCKNKDKNIALLKMDIEGAEIEVLEHMISLKIFPKQIALEYDELNFPTKFGIQRVKSSIQNLKDHGYSLVWSSGESDFLFLKN
jgi:FkbM family methyltransferase